jgi:Fe-S cluster biogenesis protein NfuA
VLRGYGLERVLEHVAGLGEAGAAALDACARDEVAGGLLLLHGVHPLGLEERVLLALDSVRPYLASHGGDVELLGIRDGVARLRLVGSCYGCRSSSLTMKQTVEEAILGRAPDVVAVEVEGEAPAPMTTPDGRPLVVLSAG